MRLGWRRGRRMRRRHRRGMRRRHWRGMRRRHRRGMRRRHRHGVRRRRRWMVVVVRPPVVGAAVVVPVSGGLADGLREARDAKRDAYGTRELHRDDDVVPCVRAGVSVSLSTEGASTCVDADLFANAGRARIRSCIGSIRNHAHPSSGADAPGPVSSPKKACDGKPQCGYGRGRGPGGAKRSAKTTVPRREAEWWCPSSAKM